MANDEVLLIAVKMAGVRQAVGDAQVIKGEIKEIGTEGELAGKKLKGMEFNAGLLGTGLGKLWKWTKIGTLGVLGLGVASGVAGANFEQHMASVRAVTKATDAQMKMLSNTALHEATVTRFSASEAADGMYRLGRAGFNANQILQAIPGTLNLAHASSVDMATAAQIEAESLRSFGLQAGKAGYVADILAKATQGGAMSMQDIGAAVKYFGATAFGTGQKLAPMVAILKAMALHAVRGSRAGTTLRQALSRLVNPQKQTAKGLELMNIQASDLYDSKGLKGLPVILDTMYKHLQSLDKVSQKKAISETFGQNALGGMMAVFNQGPKAMAKFIYQMTHAGGTAKQMADTLNNTVQMRLLRLWHTLEAIGIQFALAFSPEVRALLERILAPLGKISDYMGDLMYDIKHGEWNTFAISIDNIFGAHHKLYPILEKVFNGIRTTWIFIKTILLPVAIQWGKVAGVLIVGALIVLVSIMGFFNQHATAAKFIIGLLIIAYLNWKLITLGVFIVQKALALWTVLMTLRMLALRAAAIAIKIAMIAFRLVLLAISAASKIFAGAMWLVNLAMDANPVMLIIIGLVALGVAFYLLYTKVTWFRNGVNTIWNWIVNHWKLLAVILFGPFGLVAIWIVGRWGTLVSFFENFGSMMVNIAKGMWDWMKAPFKAVMDWIWGYFKPIYDKIIMVKNWLPGGYGGTGAQPATSAGGRYGKQFGYSGTGSPAAYLNGGLPMATPRTANTGKALAPRVVEPVTTPGGADDGLIGPLMVHAEFKVDGKTILEAVNKAKSTTRARRGG